jgi:hypothetical protein
MSSLPIRRFRNRSGDAGCTGRWINCNQDDFKAHAGKVPFSPGRMFRLLQRSAELPSEAGVLSGLLPAPVRRDVACILLLLALNAALWAGAHTDRSNCAGTPVYYVGNVPAEREGISPAQQARREIRAVNAPPAATDRRGPPVGRENRSRHLRPALRWAWALACLAVAVGMRCWAQMAVAEVGIARPVIDRGRQPVVALHVGRMHARPSALALIGFVAVARRTGGWGREGGRECSGRRASCCGRRTWRCGGVGA